MGKYNIRKATGRLSSNSNDFPTESFSSTVLNLKESKESPTKKPNVGAHSASDLDVKLELFDKIVSHSYISSLEKCPIVPFDHQDLSGMGWFRITRVVLDGEAFFPDQLASLYNALHNVARNVSLVIEKKSLDNIEVYLGARDFNGSRYEASSLLGSAIHGFLPGVKVIKVDSDPLAKEFAGSRTVASYSGVASLRDDKKEKFAQGIEKFIDATLNIPSFTAIFVADNVSQEQARSIMYAYSNLEDAFKPLAEWQDSITESETEGVSSSITKTIGESITDSLSETVTRSEGTNQSYSTSIGKTWSEGTTKTPNILKKIKASFLGGESGTSYNTSTSEQTTEQSGTHTDFSNSHSQGQSTTKNNSNSTNEGTNSSTSKGSSKQFTCTNTFAKNYVTLLERHIERIQNGLPYGLWSVATYFISPHSSTSRKLANIYRGCVTGEESDLDANAVNVWEEKKASLLLPYLRQAMHPRFYVDRINVSPGELVSSKELAIHMSMPQSSVPGVEVRECAAFGRNVKKLSSKENAINIGYVNHLGNVSSQAVILDLKELSKHMFITGSTGSGKSNTVYLLINEFIKNGKKILVIEPSKDDYRKVFGGRQDFTVYGTREDEKHLLRINPFAFPDGIRVVEHVERLVEIFGVCWPMYAAMPAVLKNSILSAYESCGWNLRTSVCKYGRLFPTIQDVVYELKRIIRTSQYAADTKGDYIGALQTRLESLTNGVYASIFTSDPVAYEDLYGSIHGKGQNVIIHLNNIGSSETRSLLMGLIVLGLNEWRMVESEDLMDQELHHITILEEAHCILPRVSKQQNQESSNMIGKSVEMLAAAMAEMRTYGESFIIVDQSPSAVDEAAIRNTNTKIIMNLPDGDDREIAGKSIALTKDVQIAELARMSTGEAIIWQRGWSDAVMATIPEMVERNPLLSKDNRIGFTDEPHYIPSNLFIQVFVMNRGNIVSNIDRTILKKEIMSAPVSSSIKAKLLQELEVGIADASKTTDDALLSYLKLTDQLIELLHIYAAGQCELIVALKKYMIIDLKISSATVQNQLLSQLFNWVSIRNPKLEPKLKASAEAYRIKI